MQPDTIQTATTGQIRNHAPRARRVVRFSGSLGRFVMRMNCMGESSILMMTARDTPATGLLKAGGMVARVSPDDNPSALSIFKIGVARGRKPIGNMQF